MQTRNKNENKGCPEQDKWVFAEVVFERWAVTCWWMFIKKLCDLVPIWRQKNTSKSYNKPKTLGFVDANSIQQFIKDGGKNGRSVHKGDGDRKRQIELRPCVDAGSDEDGAISEDLPLEIVPRGKGEVNLFIPGYQKGDDGSCNTSDHVCGDGMEAMFVDVDVSQGVEAATEGHKNNCCILFVHSEEEFTII